MRLGNKKIFHLEAWVVKVMSLYKVSASRSSQDTVPTANRLLLLTLIDSHYFLHSQHFFYDMDMSAFE